MNALITRAARLAPCSAGLLSRRPVASWRSDDDFRHPNNINNGNWFGILRLQRKEARPEWEKLNTVMYTPREPGEEQRPAEVCHGRDDIMYSRKMLWQTGLLLSGLSVEEASKQLAHRADQGARIWEEILSEAIELAVREHNVELASNLWIGEWQEAVRSRAELSENFRKFRGKRSLLARPS